LLALAVTRLPVWQGYALAGATAVAALVAVALLERAPFERQPA
jgi:pantoate kinase